MLGSWQGVNGSEKVETPWLRHTNAFLGFVSLL